MFRTAVVLSAMLGLAAPALAQNARSGSLAAETDILSYGLSGYSAIFSGTLPNRLQLAFGVGRYDVPEFLVSAEPHHDVAQWEASVTSLQVARATYRFRGAAKNGPALGVVMLNQNWHLQSSALDGDTRFRVFSVGLTGGYYVHVGQHFYLYPTAAITHNSVSGRTVVNGTGYEVERFSPNASLHVGWEWRR